MTVETFYEKFELLADTPNAIEKMRELILAMAVQGRLADPIEDDPAVADLVKQLRDAKAPSGRKNGEDTPETSGIELPFALPAHWAHVRLCDIGTLSGGHTPSKNNARFWMGDVQWFTSKDIKTDELHESELKITPAAADSPGLRLYPAGCLFMVARSGILKRTFPVAINRVPATANQDLKVLRPFVRGLERYLQIMFRGLTPFILSDLVKTGMTVQSLKYDEFAVQPFPLPPLAEQKRIVAKVDELMGLCDRLEAEQAEREAKHAHLARAALARFAEAPTLDNLTFLFHDAYTIDPADLRKSILTMAVQGKLVPQVPEDQPAAEILKRIGRDASEALKNKRMSRNQRVEPIDQDGLFELPVSWEWSQLGRLVAPEDNAMCDGPFGSKLKTEHYVPDRGFAVLRLGNIGLGRFIYGKEGYISRDHFESLAANQAAEGDLLVAGLADPLLRCCEVPADILPAVNKSDCFRVRLHPGVDRTYIRHYLNSPTAKAFAAEENHGMTRERINLASAKALPVPLPPLPEQRRIVAKVDQLMALVDQLEAQLAESRAAGERLMEAVVAELRRPTRAKPTAGTPAILVELKRQPGDSRVANAGRFACYVLDRWRDLADKGRTKLEKANHFAEYHCGVPLDRDPIRYKRGPVDYELLKAAERWAGEHDGFRTDDPGNNERVVYTPGPALGARAAEAEALVGDRKAELDRMLDLIASLNTQKCGLVATAYAAWNDLLLEGKTPNDRDIIRDARHQWHETKESIPDKSWFWAIRWLEANQLTPRGTGRSTRSAP